MSPSQALARRALGAPADDDKTRRRLRAGETSARPEAPPSDNEGINCLACVFVVVCCARACGKKILLPNWNLFFPLLEGV